MRRHFLMLFGIVLAVSAVSANAQERAFTVDGTAGSRLVATPLSSFDQPWAMTFLPDGRLVVSEKVGNVVLVSADGRRLGTIGGVPRIQARGQGGLGDIVLHPDFAQNGLVYLSYVERDGSRSGAVVVRGRLRLSENGGQLENLERIWEQVPKVTGNGHYSHRMAFSPDGKLFITSGDRQKLDPAQDMGVNLGKVIRLNEDGSVPRDNPFVGRGGVTEQVWTLGHRNPLGIAFDGRGRLWAHEMGPRGGDELNRIVAEANYGWPRVSEGRHYSGVPIPDHATDRSFRPPAAAWVPSISPAGFVIYDGGLFPGWRGHGLMGGLSSRALIRVTMQGDSAREAERFSWGRRVREVEEGPDGALWVLEDEQGGRLIRLTPAD